MKYNKGYFNYAFTTRHLPEKRIEEDVFQFLCGQEGVEYIKTERAQELPLCSVCVENKVEKIKEDIEIWENAQTDRSLADFLGLTEQELEYWQEKIKQQEF